MQKIDLNADLGESFGLWRMGDDTAMLRIVSSANIACGGHAGDPNTMVETLIFAQQNNVTIGAHPGFNDREGFGRRHMALNPTEIERLIATQIGSLLGAAALAGAKISYVKPHGALANWAAADDDVALAVVKGVRCFRPNLAMLAISGSALDRVSRKMGCETYSEIFADRGYGADGLLLPRSQPGAILTNRKALTDRLLRYLRYGKMLAADGITEVKLEAASICFHGDKPNAVALARSVRSSLEAAGLVIQPFMKPADLPSASVA